MTKMSRYDERCLDMLLGEVQKLFPVITPHDLSINEYVINTWINETEFFNTVNFKVKGIPFYKLIAYMKHCTIFKEELLVKGSSEMTHCELSNGLRIPRDGIFESVINDESMKYQQYITLSKYRFNFSISVIPSAGEKITNISVGIVTKTGYDLEKPIKKLTDFVSALHQMDQLFEAPLS